MDELIKDIPRHIPANPRGYTKMQLEEKIKKVKELHADYPNVSASWLEMLYDFLFSKDEETLNKMVNEGLYDGPAKNPRIPVPAPVGIEITKACDVEKTPEYSREIAHNENQNSDGLL
tara:strand:- start:408 stop:761 length:354 start_codon:yes stop_codon:yes gene_type:complete